MRRVNEDNDEALITKKLLHNCQFSYTKLEKGTYTVKLIEKQGKAMVKVLHEETIDLNDEKIIVNGDKIHHVIIKKNKTSLQENLNSSIFSPVVIVLLLLGMFNWSTTLKLIDYVKIKITGRSY